MNIQASTCYSFSPFDHRQYLFQDEGFDCPLSRGYWQECCFFRDALALSDEAPLYSLDCTATKAVLTINQAMTPISCTGTMSFAPRITPDLPTGMTYSITSVGRQHTIVISGTPKQGLNPRLFYVGYNAHVSTIEISGRALVLLLIFQFLPLLLIAAMVSIQ